MHQDKTYLTSEPDIDRLKCEWRLTDDGWIGRAFPVTGRCGPPRPSSQIALGLLTRTRLAPSMLAPGQPRGRTMLVRNLLLAEVQRALTVAPSLRHVPHPILLATIPGSPSAAGVFLSGSRATLSRRDVRYRRRRRTQRPRSRRHKLSTCDPGAI